jgi:O-antigen ligase
MAVILGAILALVPLFIAPGVIFYFDVTPKAVVLLVGAAAAAVWFAARESGAALWELRAGRVFLGLSGTAAAALAISTALSTDAGLSFGGTNWRRLGFAVWAAILILTAILAATLAAHPQLRRPLLRVIAVSGLAAGVYGILQYFGADPWIDPRTYHVGEGVWTIVRPPGTLGHADYFGVYLAMVVFLSLAVAYTEKSLAWRATGWATAGISTVAVILSGTRAALVGVLAAAVFFALWMRGRGAGRSRRAGVLALVFVAAAVVFYVSGAGEKLRARVHWSLEDRAGGARLLLWRDSVRMAGPRWAAGYGPETFAAEFPKFQSAELARAYPEFYHESPHNMLLDALTGQGIIGMLAVAGLFAVGFWAAFQARAKEPALAGALAAALTAAFVSQQFTALVTTTAFYSYAIIAMLVSLGVGAARPGRSRWAAAIAVPLALFFGYIGVRLWLADHSLELTKRKVDAGDLTGAVKEYERSRDLQPGGAGSDLWYSRRLAFAVHESAAWSSAFAAAVRATRTADDHQNAWYSLAVFYASVNDFPRTESSLRAAIQCAPRWFKPHWTLAQVLRLAGRLSEAEQEAAVAADLNGGRDAEVAQTLRDIRSQKRQSP